jgi:hypothetical protein
MSVRGLPSTAVCQMRKIQELIIDGLLSYFDRLSRITGRLYNMSFTKMRCMG